MTAAAQSSSVSLGRHTGDERRRWASPLRTADVLPSDAASCASTAFPFDRWQTGRNPSCTVRHGAVCAPSLPLQKHGAPGTGRMLRSTPIIRTDVA
jgi:hypothetical protein